MPNIVLNNMNGVAAAHACGEHDVGKGTGVPTSATSRPQNSSGSRPFHASDAANSPRAILSASAPNP